MVGVSLMMAWPSLLWLMVGLSGVLCCAAWIRHRVAVARGTEEREPTPEEAALADQQRLVELEKKIIKNL